MGTAHGSSRSSVQLQLIAGTGGSPGAGREARAHGKRHHPSRSRTPRLDAHTREVGREGVAQARAILSQVTPPEPPGHRRAS